MLKELLQYKEDKAKWISAYIKEHGCVLLTFRVNVPGNIKKTTAVLKVFQRGYLDIKETLNERQFDFEILSLPFYTAEWLSVFKVEANAPEVKRLMVELEESEPCGRLYDIDVWDSRGYVISRSDLGYPNRKCFLCHEDAFVCGRSRKHSYETLHHYIATKAELAFE